MVTMIKIFIDYILDVYIAQPNTNEQAKALKAFMEALEIDFQVSKPNGEKNPYDPEFIAKILKSKQEYEVGNFVSVKKKDPPKFLSLE